MAGPPVEVQVRVNTGGSVAGSVFNWKVISPGIITWPVECTKQLKCHTNGKCCTDCDRKLLDYGSTY